MICLALDGSIGLAVDASSPSPTAMLILPPSTPSIAFPYGSCHLTSITGLAVCVTSNFSVYLPSCSAAPAPLVTVAFIFTLSLMSEAIPNESIESSLDGMVITTFLSAVSFFVNSTESEYINFSPDL